MRLLLVLGGILGGAIPLAAQDPEPPGFSETVVVTAALEEQEEGDVAATVDVVDAAEIEARQTLAVADLLATLTGVGVVRSGAPGQVTSVFTRGTESDHTLVLWNGIELNDPYFGGFNWAFLPTDGAERVEVVRGPFSSLYGGDALGGVVQVLTAADGVSARLEAGEEGFWRTAASGGLTAGRGRLQFVGHLRGGGGPLDNDDFDGEDLAARFDWGVAAGVRVGLMARAAAADTGIPLDGGLPSPRRRIGWRERQVALPFEGDWERWRLRGQLAEVSYESAFRDPDDSFGFTAADTDSRARRGRLVASYRLEGGSWIAFGADSEEVRVDDRSVFGVNLEGARQRTRGLFAQVRRELGPVALEAGLRRDDNDVFGGQTSPRVGLVARLGGGVRLRAAYGLGFRAPSIGELFFPLSGNPELEPETSDSGELGVDLARGRWEARLTAFENRLENLIDFDFAAFRNVNIGRARSRGLEAAAGWRGERLSIRGNATWLDAEDLQTGLPLLRRPDLAANLLVGLRTERWSLQLTGRWVGRRDDVDPATFGRVENGSYERLDLAARWRGWERLAPYGRLENLADERYEEALGYPAPGRTLVTGLALSLR